MVERQILQETNFIIGYLSFALPPIDDLGHVGQIACHSEMEACVDFQTWDKSFAFYQHYHYH